MLLPSFLILLLLMIQPVCLLYTRAVMESAASSAARIMTTSGEDADEACRAFVLRRLQAVPNVSIFHEGPFRGISSLGMQMAKGSRA